MIWCEVLVVVHDGIFHANSESIVLNQSYVSETLYFLVCFAHSYCNYLSTMYLSSLFFFRQALHPLVRFRLQASLFMDIITVTSANLIELDQQQQMILNLLSTRKAYLCLQPVHIRSSFENPNAIWRLPEAQLGCTASHLQNHSDSQNELHEESLRLLSAMSRLPVEIGGFITWPLLYHPLHNAQVYVLSIEYDSTVSTHLKLDRGMISATHLCEYLSQAGESVSVKPGALVCNSIGTSSVLFNPLPPGTLCFSSMTSLFPAFCEESNVVLYGETGCGKTTAALICAARYQLLLNTCTIYLNCKKLKAAEGARLRDVLDELASAFDRAIRLKPSVLVLDDLDKVIHSYESDQTPSESAHLHQISQISLDHSKIVEDTLRYCLRRIGEVNSVVVIAVCRSIESMSTFRACDLGFAQPIEVPPLSVADRNHFFRIALGSLGQSQFNDLFIGSRGDGLRPEDIKQISHRIKYIYCGPNSTNPNPNEIVSMELQQYVPLARLGAQTELFQPTFHWSDIGGLFEAKRVLSTLLLQPSKYRKIYGRSKIRLPRGILLYGPPGCGKSIIPSALARECGYQLVSCRGPELLDKYIGSTEAKVRELFNKAKHVAPSIIFLDELDSLAPIRGSDHTGVTDRVVNQLLTFLDGVEDTADGAAVYVVGATSRPDKVDYALLRPGRLEKHIYIGYPEASDEWTDLASKVSRGFNLSSQALHQLNSGSLFERIRSDSEFSLSFSGADMKSAFCGARLSAIHAIMKNEHMQPFIDIDFIHLQQAFRKARPSLSESEYIHLFKIYSSFRGNKSGKWESAGQHDAVTPLRVALK